MKQKDECFWGIALEWARVVVAFLIAAIVYLLLAGRSEAQDVFSVRSSSASPATAAEVYFDATLTAPADAAMIVLEVPPELPYLDGEWLITGDFLVVDEREPGIVVAGVVRSLSEAPLNTLTGGAWFRIRVSVPNVPPLTAYTIGFTTRSNPPFNSESELVRDALDIREVDGLVLSPGVLTVEGSAPFRRGDVDGSGGYSLVDPVVLLLAVFLARPLSCFAAADLDVSGEINASDAVLLLTWMFGGPPPPPPIDCAPSLTEPLQCQNPCEVQP